MTSLGQATGTLDVAKIREDFPLLGEKVNGRRLVYLDSASSSQRPRQVLEAMDRYYETTHANVHRGVYGIAEEATRLYEEARSKLGRFVGAPQPEREIVFAKNATETLNLLASSYGRRFLGGKEPVVLSEMEHHANIVPWLMLAEEKGTELRYIPIDDHYRLDLENLEKLVAGAGIVSVTAMSNVLGTVNDLRPIVEAAHKEGAVVFCDASQLVPHRVVDVAAMGVDALSFTGHKMLGPTGIGVLWAREEILEEMPAFLGGGEMIRDVRLDGFSPNDVPWKFEAGTPPIAEAIGLGAAVDYISSVGLEEIAAHERALTDRAIEVLSERHGGDVKLFGPGREDPLRGGVISFTYRDMHPHDVAQVLDSKGVCVRAGHHCAKPLMRRLGVAATARASLYLYNDEDDLVALSDALEAVGELFS